MRAMPGIYHSSWDLATQNVLVAAQCEAMSSGDEQGLPNISAT